MAALRDVVVDCRHPASLARWWAGTLDGYRVAPYDEAELARLRAAGVEDLVARGATVVADRGTWVVLADPEGDEFCVFPA